MPFINLNPKATSILNVKYILCISGFLIIFFFYCNEPKEIFLSKSNSVNVIRSAELIRPMLLDHIGKDAIFTYNTSLNNIEIFNKTISDTFILNKSIDVSYEYNKVYFHNTDSIFLFHKRSGRFKIINANGHLVDSFLVPLLIDSTPFSIYYNSSHNIICSNNLLYLTVYPVVGLIDFYRYPTEIKYDLITHKIQSHYLKFPDNYVVGREWGGIGRSNSKCIGRDGIIVHSFSVFEPLITILNGKIQLQKIANSNYLINFPPKYYNDSFSNDSKYVFTYAASIGYYPDLFYDKYRNYYCRVVAHDNSINQKANMIPDYLDRTWSIMLYDQNFKFLGETFYEGGKYDFHHIMATELGLWVLSKNVKKIGNDHIYTFHLMTYTN